MRRSSSAGSAARIGVDYLVSGRLPSGDTAIPGHALPVPAKAATRKSVAVPAVPEPS